MLFGNVRDFDLSLFKQKKIKFLSKEKLVCCFLPHNHKNFILSHKSVLMDSVVVDYCAFHKGWKYHIHIAKVYLFLSVLTLWLHLPNPSCHQAFIQGFLQLVSFSM